MNINSLITAMDILHHFVHNCTSFQHDRARQYKNKGSLVNFSEGDYVLVARVQFFGKEKLCIRWRGPRCVLKLMNEYVFMVADLRNGNMEDIHGTHLKFYSDSSLDKRAIMSNVMSSETGMPVSRLLKSV